MARDVYVQGLSMGYCKAALQGVQGVLHDRIMGFFKQIHSCSKMSVKVHLTLPSLYSCLDHLQTVAIHVQSCN